MAATGGAVEAAPPLSPSIPRPGLPPGRFRFRRQITSASPIYDVVPLGSVVEYYDDTPRPPDRFRRKLSAWQNNNGSGRLVEKQPGQVRPNYKFPPTFTLHIADYGGQGVIVLTVRRTFGIDTGLRFRVAERPKAGQARVVQSISDGIEMLHLAENREAAEAWLASKTGYSRARIEEVTAQEAGSAEGCVA